MPVHLFGQPADMTSLRAIAKKYNIKIIEDAAQAHGAKWESGPVGSLGDVAGFSFQSFKNLTCGEGGAFDGERSRAGDGAAVGGAGGVALEEAVGDGERADVLDAAARRGGLAVLDGHVRDGDDGAGGCDVEHAGETHLDDGDQKLKLKQLSAQ